MTQVRLFYTKTGRMKFVSHLDMTRFFTRMLRKGEIPVYYTEGFNKHPYLNFTLPLPLGFESEYEILDFKITEEISNEEIAARLQSLMPGGIKILKVSQPKFQTKDCRFAEYLIDFSADLSAELNEFLRRESIIVVKKGKKGKEISLDLTPLIKKFNVTNENGHTHLSIILPAGNEMNVNPTLLCDAFLNETGVFYAVTKKAILTGDLQIFE